MPPVGVFSKGMSMSTPWIWMLLVVTAVAVHGKVPTGVAVQVTRCPRMAKVQPVNVPEVISIFAVLTTLAVNDALVHIDVLPRRVAGEPEVARVERVMRANHAPA